MSDTEATQPLLKFRLTLYLEHGHRISFLVSDADWKQNQTGKLVTFKYTVHPDEKDSRTCLIDIDRVMALSVSAVLE